MRGSPQEENREGSSFSPYSEILSKFLSAGVGKDHVEGRQHHFDSSEGWLICSTSNCICVQGSCVVYFPFLRVSSTLVPVSELSLETEDIPLGRVDQF